MYCTAEKIEFDPLPLLSPTEGILNEHGHHPAAYLALNQETKCFVLDDALVPYRDQGRFRFAVAGLIAPPEKKADLLQAFLKNAAEQRKRIIFLQCPLEDAQLLQQYDFSINQLGTSYARTLNGFNLDGTRFMKLRNKISRAKRAGVVVKEVGVDIEFTQDIKLQLECIDDEWLRGKHAKELAFLIGELGKAEDESTPNKRLFIAEQNGRIQGYILYSRIYGRYRGWMHDLTRRRIEAATGTMELINQEAASRFKADGENYLHFGFTPLAELRASHEANMHSSKWFSWAAQWLAQHGSFLYPVATQLQYKKKWYPDLILPEYIAFQGGFSLFGLWQFLRITNIV